jgi:hypothetical protein
VVEGEGFGAAAVVRFGDQLGGDLVTVEEAFEVRWGDERAGARILGGRVLEETEASGVDTEGALDQDRGCDLGTGELLSGWGCRRRRG